jgi:4-hydroxybenzoate polyprenyltransferase
VIGPFIESLRVRQWVKNLSVLVAPVFSQRILEPEVGWPALESMGLFCLLASGIYLLNDLADRHRDALHPVKRGRPIASGRLPIGFAGIASAVLVVSSVALGFWLKRGFGFLLLAYVGVQVAYSLGLRRVVLVDVFCIAAGFVIRVFGGGVAVGVDISDWLILTTIFLSLFLALGKRRAELGETEMEHGEHRETLKEYDPAILDQLIAVTTASVVLCYALYTLDPLTTEKFHTRNLVFTVPFVIFGVFRYLFLVHRRNLGGEPTSTLLRDLPLALCAVLWAGFAITIVYLNP